MFSSRGGNPFPLWSSSSPSPSRRPEIPTGDKKRIIDRTLSGQSSPYNPNRRNPTSSRRSPMAMTSCTTCVMRFVTRGTGLAETSERFPSAPQPGSSGSQRSEVPAAAAAAREAEGNPHNAGVVVVAVAVARNREFAAAFQAVRRVAQHGMLLLVVAAVVAAAVVAAASSSSEKPSRACRCVRAPNSSGKSRETTGLVALPVSIPIPILIPVSVSVFVFVSPFVFVSRHGGLLRRRGRLRGQYQGQ
mmetsp:Transcript_17720/g.49071  ORF Transcript_17720/g.49071 Transcript_17720/m.49071 type:complete len:246 (-) Transcript_17720:91-828(-)